jgi:hypothetical protein
MKWLLFVPAIFFVSYFDDSRDKGEFIVIMMIGLTVFFAAVDSRQRLEQRQREEARDFETKPSPSTR